MCISITNLHPEEEGALETWVLDPTKPFAFLPEIFQGRTQPIKVTFDLEKVPPPPPPPPPPPCPCCAARKLFWRKVRVGAGAFLAILLIGLLCHVAPSAHEYAKTAFASYAPKPRTTQAQHVAPPPSNFIPFSFDAGLLTLAMTPARLSESQGEALFRVLSLMDEEPVAPPAAVKEKVGCDEDDCWCLFLAVINHYPAIITNYLRGDPEDDHEDYKNDEPIDYFDWVIDVDEAILHGTTPASLPSGSTTEESASAFYEMTRGHAPKINKSDSESAAFDTTTAWPGTDAFLAIVQNVIDFGQSTSDSVFDIFRSVFGIFRSATIPSVELPSSFLILGWLLWTYLLLIWVFVCLDVFWDVRFWFLDYPLGFVYLLKLPFSMLGTVSLSLARHFKLHFLLYATIFDVWFLLDYERRCWIWNNLALFVLLVNLFSGDFVPKLRAVSLLLNAWLSRVPLFGAQIPPMARGMFETLRQWVSKIGWRAAENDNGDGLVGDMEEVRAARQRRVALERSVFGNGE